MNQWTDIASVVPLRRPVVEDSREAACVPDAQAAGTPCLVTTALVVTSVHPGRRGGCVIVGRQAEGALCRVLVPGSVAPRMPALGEAWRLTGHWVEHAEYGPQIHANIALPLMPSGRAIVRLLAVSPRFPGVGWKTAQRLWDAYGEKLYAVLERRDAEALAAVAGPDRAAAIIEGFGLYADEVVVIRELDRHGVAARTAAAAAAIWGSGAIARIAADPYSFALLEPWADVDGRALRLGLSAVDPRRLLAAVDEAFARLYARGDTAATRPTLLPNIARLLGTLGADRAASALQCALEAGRAIDTPSGFIQSRACSFMEREVEHIIARRLSQNVECMSQARIEAALDGLQAALKAPPTRRQREAVAMGVTAPVSLILGGAGTGKTATVRAILNAAQARLQETGGEILQVAVAGRAAKRITEATGYPAITLAALLRRIAIGKGVPRSGLLVVDEASMLDLPAFYRLLIGLPPTIAILLVGDPAQLPPIGPGLPFHRLAESAATPKVVLDTIHRQELSSGIPLVAQAIREGRLPELPTFDPASPGRPGVFIYPSDADGVAAATLRAFRALAGRPPTPGNTETMHKREVQVLAPVRQGLAGTRSLNRAIEAHWMAGQPPIADWGLAVGSRVVWLKNDYDKAPLRDTDGALVMDPATGKPVCAGFMNGSLGIVRRATELGAWLELDDGSADEIRHADLEKLTHGWAISIHKAQGSAFRRVIVPVTTTRLLDRSLLYTAVTRAIEQCVLVGCEDTLRRAVAAPPKAVARACCLDFNKPWEDPHEDA